MGSKMVPGNHKLRPTPKRAGIICHPAGATPRAANVYTSAWTCPHWPPGNNNEPPGMSLTSPITNVFYYGIPSIHIFNLAEGKFLGAWRFSSFYAPATSKWCLVLGPVISPGAAERSRGTHPSLILPPPAPTLPSPLLSPPAAYSFRSKNPAAR